MEHATRPSTLGFVLGSNPLSLLAWIGEKFLAWSDVSPDLETILESVMLYWLTESGGRGLYPYRQKLENGITTKSLSDDPAYYIEQPLGYSYFPKKLIPTPISWVATTGNLVYSKMHDKGGHFAALEQPELLMEDIEEFVKKAWTR